ncbi:MAG: transposase [Candidatus Tectimicrobiota bacterium]
MCAPLFSQPVWEHAKVVWSGAILTAGNRTVTACWRVMGWGQARRFVNDHRVVNRARWSARAASHLLRSVLVTTCAPHGDLVFGFDDTRERRRGAHSKATGLSRDPVRSSHAHGVKASGVRWWCCLVFVPGSWAETGWGFPVLTARCPSARSHPARGRTHQTWTDKAWHVIQVGRRGRPTRPLVCVTERSVAVRELLGAVRHTAGGSLMTRWRLDAALGAPVPARLCGQRGRPRVQGARHPSPQHRLDDATTVWTTLIIAGG